MSRVEKSEIHNLVWNEIILPFILDVTDYFNISLSEGLNCYSGENRHK